MPRLPPNQRPRATPSNSAILITYLLHCLAGPQTSHLLGSCSRVVNTAETTLGAAVHELPAPRLLFSELERQLRLGVTQPAASWLVRLFTPSASPQLEG